MAYTQTDLDQVEAALKAAASGRRVTDVQNGDTRLRYADTPVKDLLILRDRMARDLTSVVTGQPRPARAFRGYLSNGY